MDLRIWTRFLWSVLWAAVSLTSAEDCANNTDDCSTLEDFTPRLCQTPTLSNGNTGRLEICINGRWGTVASTERFWPQKNILVACQALGFPSALNSVPIVGLGPSDKPSSSVPVHIREVSCDGFEGSLGDCRFVSVTGSGSTSSSHIDDVFIVCLPGPGIFYSGLHQFTSALETLEGDVRLKGDGEDGAGVVEIYTRSFGWATICPDSSWGSSDARVICQNLGYEFGEATITTLSSDLLADRLLYDTQCNGNTDSDLFRVTAGDCNFQGNQLQSSTVCPFGTGTYAGVRCSSSRDTGSLRIFAEDESDNRVRGIIEVFVDSRWGVVCSPSIETHVAEATCEGLGYQRAGASLSSLPQEELQALDSRLKPVWYPNIECDESASSLSDCVPGRPVGYGGCPLLLTISCNDPPLSGGQVAAIVVTCLIVVGFIIWFFVHGKPNVWDKRHNSNWYRKFTGCTSSCRDGFRGCWRSLRSCSCCHCQHRQTNVSPQPAATTTNNTATSPPAQTTPTRHTFSLSRAPAPAEPSPAPEPEPEPEPDPEIPQGSQLTATAPPSYSAAATLPTPREDLPPPYPGPPSSSAKEKEEAAAVMGAAYPPPTQTPYPPFSGNPAYPPSSGNPAYPPSSGNPAYPPSSTPYPPPT